MGDEHLGGRLPLLDPATLDEKQRSLMEYLATTKLPWAREAGFEASLPDGRLIGPFNGFLYAPEMARAYNGWVDAESAHTSLGDDVRQVIILTVGAAWSADYEVYAHAAVGRKAGLSAAAITAIVEGGSPDDVSPAAAVAHRFTRALVRHHAVDDPLYAEAEAALGVEGLVGMTHLIGQYLATSALLNAFRVPAPRGG